MSKPVAWIVTTEKQNGEKVTYPITGRYKDVKDVCDFGEPTPLYDESALKEARIDGMRMAMDVADHKTCQLIQRLIDEETK